MESGVAMTVPLKNGSDHGKMRLEPAELLIIGFGNPCRSDDRMGWLTARWLQRRYGNLLSRSGIRILAEVQLLPEHAADALLARQVLFIDCAFHIEPPFQLQSIEAASASPWTNHGWTPSHIMTLAENMSASTPERAPQAHGLWIRGETMTITNSMSASARFNLRCAWKWLEQYLTTNFHGKRMTHD